MRLVFGLLMALIGLLMFVGGAINYYVTEKAGEIPWIGVIVIIIGGIAIFSRNFIHRDETEKYARSTLFIVGALAVISGMIISVASPDNPTSTLLESVLLNVLGGISIGLAIIRGIKREKSRH